MLLWLQLGFSTAIHVFVRQLQTCHLLHPHSSMARRTKQQPAAATPTPPATGPSSSESRLEAAVTPALAAHSAPVDDDFVASAEPHAVSSQPEPARALLPPSHSNSKTPRESTTETVDNMNGTIHVTVLNATNLPTMDFGKRQDPFGRL